MSIILGLDCSERSVAAALVSKDSGTILAADSREVQRAAENVIDVVCAVCADARMELSDISQVAVISGPGSFTGLRSALSFAAGFCSAGELPLSAIDAQTADKYGEATFPVCPQTSRAAGAALAALSGAGSPQLPPYIFPENILEYGAKVHAKTIAERRAEKESLTPRK